MAQRLHLVVHPLQGPRELTDDESQALWEYQQKSGRGVRFLLTYEQLCRTEGQVRVTDFCKRGGFHHKFFYDELEALEREGLISIHEEGTQRIVTVRPVPPARFRALPKPGWQNTLGRPVSRHAGIDGEPCDQKPTRDELVRLSRLLRTKVDERLIDGAEELYIHLRGIEEPYMPSQSPGFADYGQAGLKARMRALCRLNLVHTFTMQYGTKPILVYSVPRDITRAEDGDHARLHAGDADMVASQIDSDGERADGANRLYRLYTKLYETRHLPVTDTQRQRQAAFTLMRTNTYDEIAPNLVYFVLLYKDDFMNQLGRELEHYGPTLVTFVKNAAAIASICNQAKRDAMGKLSWYKRPLEYAGLPKDLVEAS